ncbi:hypothetical protein [Actinoplanes sp. TFC3]|uniref:hypothetical protein n=1 Tax=Actinoplanes sp. TFC3 TaxID=1710355 RepID=UPI000B1D6165|nr:hypothetical protein [Actinoplanes sp. TFC3]
MLRSWQSAIVRFSAMRRSPAVPVTYPGLPAAAHPAPGGTGAGLLTITAEQHRVAQQRR